MAYNFSPLKQELKNIESFLQKELSSVRTGRATPALLDRVLVESYGAHVPIQQVGSMGVEDARTIRITPWDKSQSKDIERAIVAANLGVSVSVDDIGLRVSFPELTTERRNEFIKIAKDKLEHARIAIRTERDKVWTDIQKKEKDGELSEDEKFRGKDEMQKLIDEANQTLEAQFQKKEKEILS
jgi:ribosome recycling factor